MATNEPISITVNKMLLEENAKLQSTITAQEDIIKRLKEHGERLAVEIREHEENLSFKSPAREVWDSFMNELGEKQ